MKKEEKKEIKSISKKAEVKKTELKKKEKQKKGNLFNRVAKYFKGVGKEVKRIKWTSGKDLIKYSIAAVAFVVFFGIYFYGIDWIALLVRSLAK